MLNILLIAGHGGGDCGAIGNGYKEADLTREVCTLLKPMLAGYANVTIADTSRNWYDFIRNGGQFNFKPYDYVLEIHFNAGVSDVNGNGTTTGTEIYVTTSEKSYGVESEIVKGISNIGFKNRGVKRKNFAVINHIKNQGVSSALLEVCFIDDKDDIKLYQGKKREIAKAIANGIIVGFSLTLVMTIEKKEDELKEACDLLASKGIINSPDYWAKGAGYSDENTVLLIKKFASYVRGA